ncbi:MAG: hypothetical protein K0Q90_3795, partial [Paenibacillaceae bacterium]|nr:hypothetical protein [Paenibacillaceae bacterium]
MPTNSPAASETDTMYMYALAGIGTAPGFMEEFHDELARRLAADTGLTVAGGLLYPYGEWSRSVRKQIWEVWRDIRLPAGGWERSRGVAAVHRELAPAARGSGPVVLVGHSGGGTAAVHAAAMLLAAAPERPVAVVQIGSPRSPVPPALQEATVYCFACGPDGRGRDPVCRLGSWRAARGGGGRLGLGRLLLPGQLVPLPIAGWHPDYFRGHLLTTAG